MGERRAQLYKLADSLEIALGGTGTHPWSSWKDQRIIDTPHYRRNDQILRLRRLAEQQASASTSTRRSKGPDRAIAVNNALRNYLPELLALSASSPFVEGVSTRLHSARTEIFTRMFPRCGVPDSFASWDEYERFVRFLYDTKSIDEHTQIWWSVRPHLAFPTVEIRICDGQPDLEEARSLAALLHALTVRIARAIDEGEPLPDNPHRMIEENLWRAIRFGLAGEMIDLSSGRVRPTRVAIEELIEWSLPAAEETGAITFIRPPETNAAVRQIERHEAGASLEEIYAEQVRQTREQVSERVG